MYERATAGATAPATTQPQPGGAPQVRGLGAEEQRPGAGELLQTFLQARHELDRDERQLLAEQARRMIEATYVHLPQKRAMYAIDPVQRLRLLEYRLEQLPRNRLPRTLAFHNEMTEIFTSLRDLHTNYLLPQPFADKVAYLPFLIEEYYDRRGPRYLVTHVDQDYARPPFGPGAEVLNWNGIPIQTAIELHGARQAGANPYARHDLGLASLTIRPLMRVLPPDEEWATITYRAADGRVYELRQDWLVRSQQSRANVVAGAAALGEALALGFDLQTDQIQETRKDLFAPWVVAAERAIARGEQPPAAAPNHPDSIETTLPGIFRAEKRRVQRGTAPVEVGYIRIFTFLVADADAFVQELCRLLEALPERGLILDVRGNGGGNILACERSLQLFTDATVEPQNWQFINSPLTLELSRRYYDLAPWEPSIAQAVELGTLHSLAYPITAPDSCNAIGRRYPGPVVLIIDGMCYSATDVFAAGIQDHQVGKILGTSGNTGAGGANVWTHDDLQALLAPPGQARRASGPFVPLPDGAGMRVAVRRGLRVKGNAGIPVEDLGISPDQVHHLTKRDVLGNNDDLLARAVGMLDAG